MSPTRSGDRLHEDQDPAVSGRDLADAAAHVESPPGQVSSTWTRKDGGEFMLRVSVPVGATAEILVAARDRDSVTASGDATFEGMRDGYAAFQVGSGTYVFHAAM